VINQDVVGGFGEVFRAIADYSPLLFVVYPLSFVVSMLSYLLCIYACLSAGCAWAKKHRIALAVLLIFGVYVVTSIIGTIADSVVAIFAVQFSYLDLFMSPNFLQTGLDYLLITLAVHAVINIVLLVAYCAFMHHALANRLNLE
jgi:hypothetical protein